MPGLDPLIFSVALSIFLFTGATNLTIDQLISIVILFKKLKAIMKSDYSLESAKLEERSPREPDRPTIASPAPQSVTQVHFPSPPSLDVSQPIVAPVDGTVAFNRVILPLTTSVFEVERLALNLSEKERVTLAARLLHSLPSVSSDQHHVYAEAFRHDAANGADPADAISRATLDSE
jgi:hypothetical protein